MKNTNIFKSISEFLKRKSYTIGFSTDTESSNESWDGRNYLQAYEILFSLNKAISKRAEKLGGIQFTLKKGGVIYDEKSNEPWLQLLRKPNKLFTGQQFFDLYQRYLDIFGEVYIWKKKSERQSPFDTEKIIELHIFRPDTMSYEMDDNLGITKYFRQLPNGQKQQYNADEIIRDFNPDPATPIKGESLISAGVRQISTGVQLANYQANILKNGGRIGGLFSLKTETLTKQQRDELKDEYLKDYAEAKQSGKPLFLSGNTSYERMSMTPDELGFIESTKINLNDICVITGVPKPLLSTMDEIKFDNADSAVKIFLRETIAPLMKRLVTRLNWDLIPDGLELDFVNPVPEDKEQIRQDLKAGSETYCLTTNEKRQLLNLDPVSDGDDILVPLGFVTLGDTMATETDTPSGDGNTDDDKNTKSIKNFKHPLSDNFIRRKYWDYKIIKLDKREAYFKKHLDRYFKAQQEELLGYVKGVKTFRKKDLIDDFFNIETNASKAIKLFIPLFTEFMIESGTETMNFIGYKDFNFVLSSKIQSWIDEKASVSAWEINETTKDNLKTQFEESFLSGEGRDGLVKRIKDVYQDTTTTRAKTIARTEVGGITSKGTFEAYRQANIPIKIWVAVMDSKTRDSHVRADGEEVPIDQPFSNGLQYPGDPRGDAGETINCRCQI